MYFFLYNIDKTRIFLMEQLCILLLDHDYTIPTELESVNDLSYKKHAMEIAIKIFGQKLRKERDTLNKGLPTTEMINLKLSIHDEIMSKIDLRN